MQSGHSAANEVAGATSLSGALSGANFAPNATGTAGGNNSRFIYESDDGFLNFDADGSDGAFTAVKLATLSGAPVITETDIVLARKTTM